MWRNSQYVFCRPQPPTSEPAKAVKKGTFQPPVAMIDAINTHKRAHRRMKNEERSKVPGRVKPVTGNGQAAPPKRTIATMLATNETLDGEEEGHDRMHTYPSVPIPRSPSSREEHSLLDNNVREALASRLQVARPTTVGCVEYLQQVLCGAHPESARMLYAIQQTTYSTAPIVLVVEMARPYGDLYIVDTAESARAIDHATRQVCKVERVWPAALHFWTGHLTPEGACPYPNYPTVRTKISAHLLAPYHWDSQFEDVMQTPELGYSREDRALIASHAEAFIRRHYQLTIPPRDKVDEEVRMRIEEAQRLYDQRIAEVKETYKKEREELRKAYRQDAKAIEKQKIAVDRRNEDLQQRSDDIDRRERELDERQRDFYSLVERHEKDCLKFMDSMTEQTENMMRETLVSFERGKRRVVQHVNQRWQDARKKLVQQHRQNQTFREELEAYENDLQAWQLNLQTIENNQDARAHSLLEYNALLSDYHAKVDPDNAMVAPTLVHLQQLQQTLPPHTSSDVDDFINSDVVKEDDFFNNNNNNNNNNDTTDGYELQQEGIVSLNDSIFIPGNFLEPSTEFSLVGDEWVPTPST